MRIISWNVNGIRACAEKGLWNFLNARNPDMFCIQETKAHPDQLDAQSLNPGGRHSYWSSALKRGYSGVATFCREEPQNVEYGIGIRKFDSEGRFVITDHKRFTLYNVYFPNGGMGVERHLFKQEFLARFLRHLQLQMRQGKEIIVVGDYNVAHRPIDVYDPEALAKESGFLPEERKWFDQFLDAGFVDSFRYLHPQERDCYSWWSYQSRSRLANRGWRIDYICTTKGIASQVKKAAILDDVEGSDHCPVEIEIDLN